MANNSGEEKVFKIEKVEALSGSKFDFDIADSLDTSSMKNKFDSAMTSADIHAVRPEPKVELIASTQEVQQPSPIDQMAMEGGAKVLRLEPATLDTITTRASAAQELIRSNITTLENSLNQNPSLKLARVDEAALSSRLVHVDSSLKSALSIAGIEAKGASAITAAAPATPSAGIQTLKKFVGYLAHGDGQIASLVSEVNNMGASGEKIRPEKLFAIQLKLGFVQQEIEFFTNLLNKALESAKTVMNVQV